LQPILDVLDAQHRLADRVLAHEPHRVIDSDVQHAVRHQQNHPQALARRFHDDGRVCSPGHLRQVFLVNEIQIRSKGIAPPGHHADQAGQQRQIRRRERVVARAERIQHFPLAHEDRRLAFLHDDLRSHPPVAATGLRLAVGQLIIHDIDMVNDINNPRHLDCLLKNWLIPWRDPARPDR